MKGKYLYFVFISLFIAIYLYSCSKYDQKNAEKPTVQKKVADNLKKIAKPQIEKCKLTILGNDKKPPKIYLDNGVPKGILIDMMEWIGREMNCQFSYTLVPWKRAYYWGALGKGALIGFSKTEEREKIFDYSNVMYYNEMILVVLKGKEFPFKTIDDLKGKKLGVVLGASFGQEFESALKKGIFTTVPNTEPQARLLQLLKGRVDAVLIGPGKTAFETTLKKDPKLLKNRDKFTILPKPFTNDPNYLGILKKLNMKEFLTKFNKALKKGHEKGAFDKIKEKYSH